MPDPVRYRFAEFVLSPRQRLLIHRGAAVPVIPKYFDLLQLLVHRRRDVVTKQVIFTEVWSDVIVSDGALSQAVRTLRRTLGDDSREPRFIRTVARHGYQFIWAEVIEEADDGEPIGVRTAADAPTVVEAPRRSPETGPERNATDVRRVRREMVERLVALAGDPASEDEARDLAERLHTMGTADAVAQVVATPGHAAALAMLRDARWSVPGAGPVPLGGDADIVGTMLALVRLRLAAVRRTIAQRWAFAVLGGVLGGVCAGVVGGLALVLAPVSNARPESMVALGVLGALAGGVGAAGIGGGLMAAEALARSRRGLALVVCGAASGAIVAAAAAVMLRALLNGLVGSGVAINAGWLDGLVLGAAAGAGYALATPQPPGGGLAAPRGLRRLVAVLIVGAVCFGAAAVLALAGRPLVGGTLHEIATSARDAQLVLEPLGYFIGEPGFGAVTRVLLGALEGGTFGTALALGLTRRPRRV